MQVSGTSFKVQRGADDVLLESDISRISGLQRSADTGEIRVQVRVAASSSSCRRVAQALPSLTGQKCQVKLHSGGFGTICAQAVTSAGQSGLFLLAQELFEVTPASAHPSTHPELVQLSVAYSNKI